MAGAERYFRLIDLEPEWKDSPTAKALPAIQGRVEFENVQFEYDRGRPVLADIAFVAEPGRAAAPQAHVVEEDEHLGVALLARFGEEPVEAGRQERFPYYFTCRRNRA